MTYTSIQDIGDPAPTVLAVGFFDGVHLGHHAVLSRVIAASRRHEARSAIVTFHPHPRTVLTESTVPLLSTLGEKSELLFDAGIDLVVVVPFNRTLSGLTAREFVSDILMHRIGLIHMAVGYDHSVGKDAEGDASAIARIGQELGFTTEIIDPQSGPYGAFSSSQIREALQERGDLDSANAQLGRPYSLEGTVVHGDARGRGLGFPTANLDLGVDDKVIPANGVYAVKVSLDRRGNTQNGIMNIGVRPTLTSGLQRILEVHLLDFEGDLYGETLRVEFVRRIRSERKFGGVAELQRQIKDDISDCIRIHEVLS